MAFVSFSNILVMVSRGNFLHNRNCKSVSAYCNVGLSLIVVYTMIVKSNLFFLILLCCEFVIVETFELILFVLTICCIQMG